MNEMNEKEEKFLSEGGLLREVDKDPIETKVQGVGLENSANSAYRKTEKHCRSSRTY